MKIQSKLTAVFSIAAMVTGPLAMAEDAAPVAPEIAICEKAPEIAFCPEIIISPEPPVICVLPPPEEPLPVDKGKGEDSGDVGTLDTDTPVVEGPTDADGGNGVPIEWVKRGGGDGEPEPPVICVLPPPEEPLPVDKGKEEDSGDAGTLDTDTPVLEGPTDANGGNEVPIDWVKRSGGDGEVPVMYMAGGIAYNMAGGPAPLLEKGATSRELGQDDKAAAIETKANAATPSILSENKEPVALIKKGRVFLR